MAGRKAAKSASIEQPLRQLADALPLYAEESIDRESIDESVLADKIARYGMSVEGANAQVALIRHVFTALGLLDPKELVTERWAFVSFPASLLARSILQTLSTSGQSFFPAGYWMQGMQRAEHEIDEQRYLLRRLETWRRDSHPQQKPLPIRVVHVAWGLIKLGGRFPLRTRDDKPRFESRRFVFPGGRLIPADLLDYPDNSRLLYELTRPNSALVAKSLPRTLERELLEELGLTTPEYEARLVEKIDSFIQVEGAANNHALTQYNIAIYLIHLSHSGELKVLDRIASEPDYWDWFSVHELAEGKHANGSSAYIDAITSAKGTDLTEFLTSQIPDSSTKQFRYLKSRDSLHIPVSPGLFLQFGPSGKQRPISFAPSLREWELLITLGWNTRRLSLQAKDSQFEPLGAGWIKLGSIELTDVARKLAERLRELRRPILDLHETGHCRLDISPEHVYFDPRYFEYEWDADGERKNVVLRLKPVETSISALDPQQLLIPLEPGFVRNLRMLETGQVPGDSTDRQSRNHFRGAKQIGLCVFTGAINRLLEIVVPELGKQ